MPSLIPKTFHDATRQLAKQPVPHGEFHWPYAFYTIIVGSAIILGWLLDRIFHAHALGLGFYIIHFMLVLATLSLVFLAHPHNKHWAFNPFALGWLLLSLFFSLGIVLRDSPWLTFFNVSTVLLLLALFFVNANKQRFFDIEIGPIIFLKWFFQSFHRCFRPFRYFFGRFSNKKIEKNLGRDIIVALIIGIPLVLFITFFLVISDAVVQNLIERLLNNPYFFTFFRDVTHFGMVIYALFFAGMLYSLLRIKIYTSFPVLIRSARDKNIISWISTVVAIILLIFSFIQFHYLFLDQGAVLSLGLSYAQYARQGFYALLLVAAITFTLSWFLGSRYDYESGQKSGASWYAQVLSAVLVLETLVLLVSAMWRLFMYIDVFNWTEKRFFAFDGMILMAILLLIFLVHVFVPVFHRKHYAYVFVVLFLANVLFLNVLNPDVFIANKNIVAYTSGAQEFEFDFDYTGYISADSFDAGLRLFDVARTEQEKFRAAQSVVRGWCRLDIYRQQADKDFAAFHWSREQARKDVQPRLKEMLTYYLQKRDAWQMYDFISYSNGQCGGYYPYP